MKTIMNDNYKDTRYINNQTHSIFCILSIEKPDDKPARAGLYIALRNHYSPSALQSSNKITGRVGQGAR